jgi:hypothetical protein
VSVAGTFVLYELVRRFQTTRFLFGMRPLRKTGATAPRSLPSRGEGAMTS